MPLDGHGHLVAQGWEGIGSGLRNGSISKPIIIAQKKNLAGLGKDRDEAFPFWDHVFSAAVGAIQIKISNSDDEDSDASDSEETAKFQLKRTSTGILSNRRPPSGIAADSGATTPTSSGEDTMTASSSRTNVMVLAKRDAARKGLYARFFRGPVLGPDSNETVLATLVPEAKVDVKGKGKSKCDVQGETIAEAHAVREKALKKRKRSELVCETKAQLSTSVADGDRASDLKRKKKKRLKDENHFITNPTAADSEGHQPTASSTSQDPDPERQLSQVQRRAEKEAHRQRKAERALKREKKAARKAAKAESKLAKQAVE